MLTRPVNNDFHQTQEIFNIFEGLEVPNMDEEGVPIGEHVNGTGVKEARN